MQYLISNYQKILYIILLIRKYTLSTLRGTIQKQDDIWKLTFEGQTTRRQSFSETSAPCRVSACRSTPPCTPCRGPDPRSPRSACGPRRCCACGRGCQRPHPPPWTAPRERASEGDWVAPAGSGPPPGNSRSERSTRCMRTTGRCWPWRANGTDQTPVGPITREYLSFSRKILKILCIKLSRAGRFSTRKFSEKGKQTLTSIAGVVVSDDIPASFSWYKLFTGQLFCNDRYMQFVS